MNPPLPLSFSPEGEYIDENVSFGDELRNRSRRGDLSPRDKNHDKAVNESSSSGDESFDVSRRGVLSPRRKNQDKPGTELLRLKVELRRSLEVGRP